MLTGIVKLSLKESEKKALKTFVESGGTILINAAGGKERFYTSMREHVIGIFGKDVLKKMPSTSPIYTIRPLVGEDTSIKGEKGLRPLYRRLAGKRITDLNAPRLEVVEVDGRPAVILSREDIETGFLNTLSGTVDGYTPEAAYGIVRNVISNIMHPVPKRATLKP